MYVYIYIRTQVFRKNIHTQAFRIFQKNCAHTRVYSAQNVCTQRFILAQNVCIELWNRAVDKTSFRNFCEMEQKKNSFFVSVHETEP